MRIQYKIAQKLASHHGNNQWETVHAYLHGSRSFCSDSFIAGTAKKSTATPATSRNSKIGHLLEAAEHLEAAGLTDEARKIRQQADQEKIPTAATSAGALPANNAPPQVLLHVRVMEISRTKLHNWDSICRVLSAPHSVRRPLMVSAEAGVPTRPPPHRWR